MAQERRCLPKGSKVTCPQCKRVMCISRVDIFAGQKLAAANFDAVDAPIAPHTRMECPFDGAQYGLSPPGRLHIEGRGWV